MKEIKLNLNIDDANLILEALGTLPFARVFGLIGKIQEQAGQQLNGKTEEPQPLPEKDEAAIPELKD